MHRDCVDRRAEAASCVCVCLLLSIESMRSFPNHDFQFFFSLDDGIIQSRGRSLQRIDVYYRRRHGIVMYDVWARHFFFSSIDVRDKVFTGNAS